MFRIFASLRRLLAMERSFKVLGVVACDAINRVILPELKEMSDKEDRSDIKIKYEALMGEYREYANPHGSQAEEFASIAEKIISGFAHKYSRGMQEAEEVASNITSDFYTNPKDMQSFASPRFDVRKGPAALKRHWATIIHHKTAMEFRELARKAPADMGTDDSGVYDPYRSIPAPEERGPFSEEDEKETEKRLKKGLTGLIDYIDHKADSFGYRGELVPFIARKWLEASKDREAINFENDIRKPLIEDFKKKGKDIPARTTFFDGKRIFLKLVEQYFTDELNIRVPDRVKQKWHMSSVDVISYEAFRIKVARWVLSI